MVAILHLMIIHQESLGIENRQIWSFLRFIHRNGGSFLHRPWSISERALVCFILRENSSNDLSDITSWHSKTPIILTENGINWGTKLAIGISGI
jgi:hypothetical protein